MTPIMDVYIRVSRVGAREGAEYRTPHIQREEIRRWLAREGYTPGKEIVEEDVSGGKAVGKRRLEELIVRAEQGVTAGVIAYRIDRFGRDHVENIVAIKRLRDADARFVGVADGTDSNQPQSKWLINIMSMQAEDYLDRAKQNWDAVTVRAVAEGKHIAGNAPLGYLRVDQVDPQFKANGDLIRDARLVVDPETAPWITKAFAMRAHGASYKTIREAMPFRIVTSSLSNVFKRRTYLGEARGPRGVVNATAHEPLVTADVFARCQPGKAPARTGTTQGALLGGLITCASCGHKLRVTGAKSHGEHVPVYACRVNFSGGDCASPGAALVSLVNEHVLQMLVDSWDDGTGPTPIEDQQAAYLTARQAVEDAETELAAFAADMTLRKALGDRYVHETQRRVDALEAAQRELWDVEVPDADLEAPVIMFNGKPTLYEVWGDDPARDRRHLRRLIASVTLARADPARKRWQPIRERVEITWR
jgi:DNA invertase Pin-like site-specific DNA recombinase